MKNILFVIAMMLPFAAYSATLIDGLYYDLDSNTKTAKVTRNTSGTYYGKVEIIIPSSVSFNDVEYRVTGIGAWAFDNATKLTSITIPESVTYIEENAFFNCSSLSSLTIPNKVHSIYDYAFQLCSKLTSIVIPKSVTYIGNSIFGNCDGLESIIVEEGNPKYDSRNNCNAIIWETILIAGCKNTIIPAGINSIWSSAFMYCKGLTSIDIPKGVTSIGSNAFYMCSDLKSVNLPSTLETIQRAAFAECYSLESVTIPQSVKSIEMYAFGNCRLKVVTSFIETPFTINNDVFSVSDDAVLYVPKGSKNKYESTSGWNKFKNIVEITQKCERPIINYSNGLLKFECETENVEFVSEVTCPDIRKYSCSEIPVTATYTVSVYAKKDGYEDSDVATKEINFGGAFGIKGDVNEDGTVNGTDIQEVINIIVEGE